MYIECSHCKQLHSRASALSKPGCASIHEAIHHSESEYKMQRSRTTTACKSTNEPVQMKRVSHHTILRRHNDKLNQSQHTHELQQYSAPTRSFVSVTTRSSIMYKKRVYEALCGSKIQLDLCSRPGVPWRCILKVCPGGVS